MLESHDTYGYIRGKNIQKFETLKLFPSHFLNVLEIHTKVISSRCREFVAIEEKSLKILVRKVDAVCFF